MRHGARQYQAMGAAGVDGRATEIAAFRRAIADLEGAPDELARTRALGRNHDLWAALLRDLALEGNALPQPVKANLIALGLWSMNYSIAAVLRHLPVAPVVAVNRNVLDGLLAA